MANKKLVKGEDGTLYFVESTTGKLASVICPIAVSHQGAAFVACGERCAWYHSSKMSGDEEITCNGVGELVGVVVESKEG
jgi:hypothetical protein